MKELLQQVRSLKQQTAEEARAAYAALVQQCCDGAELDPAETLDILERAQLTAEHLERDCAALESRREKQVEARKLRRIEAHRLRVEAAIAAENAKVAAAVEARDAAVAPLQAEWRALEAQQAAAQRAHDWLIADGNLPLELKGRMDTLLARRAALSKEITQLRQDLHEDLSYSLVCKKRGLEGNLREVQRKHARRGDVTSEEHNLRFKIDKLEKDLAASRERRAAAEHELSAIETAIQAVQAEAVGD